MNPFYPRTPRPAARPPAVSLRAAVLLAIGVAALSLAGCTPSGTDAATGARVFQQCASCHQVGPDARGGFAPQLNGLFGRRAGSTPDFAYSPAMKASGIVWNDATLRTFLHDPGKLVPGTRMSFWGIGDEREISALLAYLRTFQDPGAGAASAPVAPAAAPR